MSWTLLFLAALRIAQVLSSAADLSFTAALTLAAADGETQSPSSSEPSCTIEDAPEGGDITAGACMLQSKRREVQSKLLVAEDEEQHHKEAEAEAADQQRGGDSKAELLRDESEETALRIMASTTTTTRGDSFFQLKAQRQEHASTNNAAIDQPQQQVDGAVDEEPLHSEGDEAMLRFEREVMLSSTPDAEDIKPMKRFEAEAEAKDVSCGGHWASSCKECSSHASWCNGDCEWKQGACKLKRRYPPTKENPFGCPPNGGHCQSRTGSVHYNFQRPSTAKSPVWYYSEVVPRNASSSTFYASNTHSYGYAGIQMNDKDPEQGGIVICSIWDQDSGKAKMETCGEGVECTGFGGEGTGAKSMWRWRWTLGRRYAMMVSRSEAPGGRVESACWFFAEELEGRYPGGWKHISTTTTGRNRWGGTFRDAGAFLEQWTHKDSGDLRRAQYGPAYYKNPGGPWGQARTAWWSGGYCVPERVRDGLVRCDITSAGEAPGGKRLYMSTGGSEQHHGENRGIKAGGSGASLNYPEHECGLPGPLTEFERHRPALLQQARARDPDTDRSLRAAWCGGHHAGSCLACPWDGSRYIGMSWCNGQCTWRAGQCMDLLSAKKCPHEVRVSCGGHTASSCRACPGKHGKHWCNGECTWRSGTCMRG